MLRIQYSCTGCALVDVELDVAERRDDQDVVDWMENLTARIGRDHRFRSPSCAATSIAEVKIPMSGTQRIGGLPIH